jgi:D-threo-aldose 1-dehydrogenase
VQALDAVCGDHNIPLARAALQFPLAHSLVVSVIAGAQTREEVVQNAAMSRAPVSPDLWRDLKAKSLLATDAPTRGDSKKAA